MIIIIIIITIIIIVFGWYNRTNILRYAKNKTNIKNITNIKNESKIITYFEGNNECKLECGTMPDGTFVQCPPSCPIAIAIDKNYNKEMGCQC